MTSMNRVYWLLGLFAWFGLLYYLFGFHRDLFLTVGFWGTVALWVGIGFHRSFVRPRQLMHDSQPPQRPDFWQFEADRLVNLLFITMFLACLYLLFIASDAPN